MKTTCKILWNAQGALSRLLAKEIPIKPALELSRLAKRVQAEVEGIDLVRRKLIKKHGDGQQVAPEKMPEFLEEFEALLGMEVALDETQPVALPQAVLERLEISAGDILALEGLVTFGE